jgi:hypothetical protein
LRFATSTCPPTVQQSRGRAQANTRPRFGAKRSGAWYLGFPLQHLQTGCSGSPAACCGPAHRIAHTTRSHPAGGERTGPPQWRGSTRPGTRLACGKHKETQHTAACTPGLMGNDSAPTFNSLHPPPPPPHPPPRVPSAHTYTWSSARAPTHASTSLMSEYVACRLSRTAALDDTVEKSLKVGWERTNRTSGQVR